MTNFKTWTQENLAKFAEEVNLKLAEQSSRIKDLERDVKDAIEAYRALMRRQEPSK